MKNDCDVVTLLYVEDEKETRNIVGEMISHSLPGVSVITAVNGEEGLRLFEAHQPEIVLTDISMPVMNGIEMANRIRSMNRKVHIIAATALADNTLLLEAIRLGIRRYVQKPIDFRQLREGISECLEQISLERQLKKQHDFIRKLSRAVDNNPGMVAIADAEGIIDYVNPKFCSISGYDASEAIGESLGFLLKDAAPAGAFDRYWSEIREGREWHGEFLNRKKNGEEYYEDFAVSASKDDTGSITDFVAVMQDITERKKLEQALQESERQFRILCDCAPIGIFRTDSAGNNVYCNPRWQEITGLRGNAVLGRGWLSGIHPEDRERHAGAWQEALAKRQRFCLEYRQLRQEEPVRWLRALAAPITTGSEEPSGFVGTLEDVTELHQARQEMLKTQKLESLSLLAGGIAHDFNNILTGVLGNIGLAKYHLGDTVEMELRLRNAEGAASRAKELTQQLLTFAKGGVPIKKVIALPHLLREAVEFALHGSNVNCRYRIDEELWPVSADEGQLMQVIHNLVLNAVQSMPEGGTVEVTASNEEQPHQGGRRIRISVSDTGVGIPEHHLQRIFDPYFTTKEKGSGLGLATSYSIIKKHDGEIRACSTTAEGACFEILLPATSRPCDTKPSLRSGLTHGSGRILVLDDEKAVRDVARAMLEELGYQVECAQDGAEAIRLFLQGQRQGDSFTVVILDLTIPGGIGGKETMKRLRELAPWVKGIVCSGYSNDPVMADHRSYGFDAVLTKPYTLEEMNEALQSLLSGDEFQPDAT